jgi:hypothetical protein
LSRESELADDMKLARLLPAAFLVSIALAQAGRPFVLYDNMFYRGKPDTAPEGLVLSNILYQREIWPHADYDVLPSRDAFEATVRLHLTNPGPLVLDIEKLPLKGPPEAARHNMEILVTLAGWAHEAAPGNVIGFYGTNTLSRIPSSSLPYARELARHVDAFFPSMYTFDDDWSAWEKRAETSIAEAAVLGPGKPVYLYLWPQYHDGTPKQFQFIDAAYWKFQLETASRYCNGIVLWSPSRYEWNDATGWWAATEQFAQELRVGLEHRAQ